LNIFIEFQRQTTASVAREIIRKHGLFGQGLYWGFSATLYRHGVWNMFYFGIYHNIKHLAPDEKLNPVGNIAARLFLGFCAGTIASIANIPFDVAKSRIQCKFNLLFKLHFNCLALPPTDPKQRYRGTWQAIQLIRKEEGVAALYRGLVPKVMRLGPGGGIMLLVFDKVYEWLKLHT
jgi:solute carrier family 25 2-oxodicarboxylate transporter 21